MKVYTYFAQAIGRRFVKIGSSTDPKRRVNDLAVGCPDGLDLVQITTVPEKLVHAIFKPYKHNREWYNIEGTLEQYLSNEVSLAKLCEDLSLEKQLIIKATEPGEEELLKHHLHGPDYYFALCDIDNWLRDEHKYHDTKSVGVEHVRDMIRELLDVRSLTLSD